VARGDGVVAEDPKFSTYSSGAPFKSGQPCCISLLCSLLDSTRARSLFLSFSLQLLSSPRQQKRDVI
jgi:hypothetical protein